jgi:RNA polymerase sigma factor (sigma-70 family)
MPSRHDEIGAYYVEVAPTLWRAVRHAITGPDALIDDACSYAWLQLLRNDQIELNAAGFGWLLIVAKREAYLASARARREPPLGQPEELPEADCDPVDSADVMFERLERTRFRRELVRGLPDRKQVLVLLHAAGFTYREIAAITGDTPRTVERQLLRGKRALRRMATTPT